MGHVVDNDSMSVCQVQNTDQTLNLERFQQLIIMNVGLGGFFDFGLIDLRVALQPPARFND